MATSRTMMVYENFGDLLDVRLSKIYWEKVKERIEKNMAPMLFRNQPVGQMVDYRVSGMGGLSDLQDFDGSITYDAPSQLYDTICTFPEKALGFKIEKKLADDNQFGKIDGKAVGMATSVARTDEKMAVTIFNESFTSTNPSGQTGGDGVALCSSSHPYSPDDSTTMDNAGSTALSPASVEATRLIGMSDILTDRGELADVNYDMILIPPGLEEDAWEIIESKGKVDTANNNANFHYGRYKLAVWNRLTSSKSWWMIDSDLLSDYFFKCVRVAPEFEQDRDFDTKVAKWSVYQRTSYNYSEWRAVYGHLVS